jgi:cytochrome c oxidase cbb3-type subunit III
MKVSKSLTRAKPVEEEEEILLDHNYDGIKELDNHLPPWWKWLFYITIVWSLIYLLDFHVFDWMPLSAEEYTISIARAEAALEAQKAASPSAAIDENNVTVTTEEAALHRVPQFSKDNVPYATRKMEVEMSGLILPIITGSMAAV